MTHHKELTEEQKLVATEMRAQKKTYAVIADLLGVELSVLKYRLPQYLRCTHPELLNRQYGRSRALIPKGFKNEHLAHYKHNDNSKKFEIEPSSPVRIIVKANDKPIFAPVANLADRVAVRKAHQDNERHMYQVRGEVNNLAYASSRSANSISRYV